MTQKAIKDLQDLASELAIQSVTIRDGGQSIIIIDWNGEEEYFFSREAAEAALREVAE